ncbi:MAG TPA: response regulator [Bacillota bacterium]
MSHVLILDDQPAVRLLLRTITESLGHRATEAGNAEQAFDLVERNPPDLILVDLNLPGASGLDFVRRLRDNGFACRVIILSASDRLPDEHLRATLGLWDCLVKPFDVGVLKSRLIEALGGRQTGTT